MSSVIFQPLLHDPLGWKQENTTYADTFNWKKYRSPKKDKRISTYGQHYTRQLEKQKKLQQTNNRLPSATNGEQTIQPLLLVKKNEENRRLTPASNRSSPSKTPPAVTEELPVVIVESKQRTPSINREATCGSRTSQHSSTVPAAAEETTLPATSSDARRSPKEEKEKVINDPNNDNSRHWLTYPNPKTPQYLIDIKQRLGQLKVQSLLIRPTSASTISVEQSESFVSHRPRQPSADQRHFLDFNLPETPNELRAARQRLERHRYNPSVDNYPPRPKTCPELTKDDSKPLTPPIAPESEVEQSQIIQTTSTKEDIWTNDEETKVTENETSSITIQTIDGDSLPPEYIAALETASFAQEEYLKNLKTNNEKSLDNFVYRLPSMSSDNKSDSFIAFRNQQQSTPPPPPPKTTTTNKNNSTRQNDFDTWIRNSTDKERESAMKILNDVLNKPIMGYDIPTKQQTVFNKSPLSSSLRTKSATRKLGRTRNPHQRIPCEICEKELIKHHVWNLSRSSSLVCPHQAPEIKPPIIQIRTG